MISIIAALAKNRVIGKKNSLPWHLPADLKYFREKTKGKVVVMGFNTFKSLGEKPLPGRENIVLTNDRSYQAPKGVILAYSVQGVLEKTKDKGEIMISGGAKVYEQFLLLAHRLYLTFIDCEFDGDVFFPEFDITEWRELSRDNYRPDEKNKYPYSFVVFERKNKI